MTKFPDTPYGNYSEFDPPEHWADNAEIPDKIVDKAKQYFRELLDDFAYDCNLDTSYWDSDDYKLFAEFLELT